jgi:DNA (cytosine-5)-methyltransferase 1
MISSLDLFAGAGGLTLGLKNAGFQSVGAIELDRFAAETFSSNFPEIPLLQSDIKQISDEMLKSYYAGVDVIVGGPPCQGFSVAGPAQYGIIDSRNEMIFEIYRAAKVLNPRLCIVENVKGILNGKISPSQKALDSYIQMMKDIGYTVKVYILQTADFGIPQYRERVFIFAAKEDKWLPTMINGKYSKGKKSWRGTWECLSDLPQITAGEGNEGCVKYEKPASNEYQELMRKDSDGVYNHTSMKHTARLVERFKHIPQGGSLLDVPVEHGQRIRGGKTLDTKPRFKMNNQRLHPEKVSAAITASFQSTFVHPLLNRNLTAREGARIQSFPDNFVFFGPRTLMSKSLLLREGRENEIGLSQYNQIGNAVAPLLAEAIGSEIINCLERR